MEKSDLNQRLLIALVLSFAILISYNWLIAPQQKLNALDKNKTTVTQKETKNINKAPVVNSVTSSAKVHSSPVGSQSKVITTVETDKYSLKIDNLGRISSLILKDSKYKTDSNKPLDIISKKSIKPLEVRFKDEKINNLAFNTDYIASSNAIDATKKEATLTLTQKLGNITLNKILTFYPDGHYSVKVETNSNSEFFITPGFRPTVDKSKYLVVRGVLIKQKNGLITTLENGDIKDNKNFDNVIVAAGIDRYYTTLFFKKGGTFKALVAPSGIAGYESEPIVFVPIVKGDSFIGYVGPKEWKLFSKIDKNLEDVVEFGWFTFLSKPFFKVMYMIYDFVGNWGWAIVLFTILVKLILFPLSYKGLMSMQKLKDLAPKMKEIREKYGKDPAKMNQQMMALYKKHGANPMGGCLPMILQIPIFFALYRVLLNADELQGAPWIGWITDLSRQDPYFILPVLMGITMFIQQKITPNNMTDPTQQKIFQWLPAIMTLFFLTFPSGLVLYWLVNNILTIAQQYYINKAYEKYKKEVKLKASKSKTE